MLLVYNVAAAARIAGQKAVLFIAAFLGLAFNHTKET
jgi:hypothetical protein